MPWTVKDVDRFKKGLSDKQKRRWVAVANSVLRRCTADGKSAETCEAAAIRQANGITGNALHLVPLTVNTTDIRYETFDGRAYLVAPVVPIQEAVLNGYLVPAEEISAYIDSWNGLALPIGHPQNEAGDYISVNSPQVLDQSIGRFFNAHMDGKKLRGEVWLDIERCEELGSLALETLQRVETGEPLECSTAFWAETVMKAGVYNGQSYEGVRTHLIPDHLALLPNGVGACSTSMGCGVHVHTGCTCQKDASMPTKPSNPALAAIHALYNIALGRRQADPGEETDLATHLTHSDIRMALQTEMERLHPSGPNEIGCYVIDVEDTQVIYRQDGKTYRRTFEVDSANKVSITGEPEEVQQDTRYVPLQEATLAGNERESDPPPDAEEKGMEKDKDKEKAPLVQALIAHAQTAWQPEDAALLNTFTPEQLTKLQEEADARAATATIPASAPPEEDDETEPAAAQATPAPAATQEPAKEAVTLEAIERLMDSKFTTFEQRLTEKAELPERQQLLTQLAVHGFTETDLTPMPTGGLRKLLSTLAPASYAGMGLPALHTQAADDGPDDDPKWD